MKKTSYQKLKEENASLKSDIYKLVMKPETMDGIGVRFAWETKFGMAERCLAGSRIKPTEDGKITCTGGIIDRSSNAEDKGFVIIPERESLGDNYFTEQSTKIKIDYL